jgi:origin recognition complex subunit 2
MRDINSEDVLAAVTATPSKRGRGRGRDTGPSPGRPKGTKTKQRQNRTPPPTNLPPHERYFFENNAANAKTSNNTLAGLVLLDHEEYFSLIRNYRDPHEPELRYLTRMHERSFPQWLYELNEGFNICLYGYGSKRQLVLDFAEYASNPPSQHLDSKSAAATNGDLNRKIIIVNGYTPSLTPRVLLSTLTTTLSQTYRPASTVASFLATLNHAEHEQNTLLLLVNSIDAQSLRRPSTQSLLATLASHPRISILATADHPNFPLLWDSSTRGTFNFLFHDTTTFQPYVVEADPVDDVNELLGRSGRRIGGKEGVGFVLKSLPEKAKNLYRVLIGEQLAAMDESGIDERVVEDLDENDEDGPANASRRKAIDGGVEYRLLYQKASEEFICGSEMAFRALLKEFVPLSWLTTFELLAPLTKQMC